MPDKSKYESNVLSLARALSERFTPPEYIPGCEVKSITDINEYTTDNGWIEAVCAHHNQQRVRYRGFPASVAVNDFVDVMHFPDRKTFEVQGVGGTIATAIDSIKVSKVWESDGGTAVIQVDANGNVGVNIGATTPSGIMHIDQDSNIGGVPTLFLDQADTAVSALKISSDSTDQDINLVQADVTGNPTLSWDESEDAFSINKGLRVTSGKIGVGVTTPLKNIHAGAGTVTPTTSNEGILASNNGVASVIALNATANIENILHVSTTAGVLGTVTNHNLEMRTNNSTRITVDTSGNVGVGASPTYFLDLTNATSNWRMRLNGTGTDSVVSLEMANDVQRYLFTVDGSASDIFKIRDATNSLDRMIINTSGNVGLGASPQGRFHTYNSISGFLIWEYDGLDATVRTVIANGTGDVLYTLRCTYVMRGSGGTLVGGSTNINNGASVNVTVGSNTVRLRVNADGSFDAARTAGSNTIKVALTVRWL